MTPAWLRDYPKPASDEDRNRCQRDRRRAREQERKESRQQVAGGSRQELGAEERRRRIEGRGAARQHRDQLRLYGSGKLRQRSSVRSRIRSRLATSSRPAIRSATQSAISRISAGPIPRVVTLGLPSLIPLGLNFDASSKGMALRFTVIPTPSATSCTCFPLRPCGRRSISMRWLSVPPLTSLSPRSCSRAASAFAFSTTRRA